MRNINDVPVNIQNCFFLEVERRSILEMINIEKHEEIKKVLMRSLKKVENAERNALEHILEISDADVKKMVTLRFIENKSYEEIGRKMGCCADAVRHKIRNYYKKKSCYSK